MIFKAVNHWELQLNGSWVNLGEQNELECVGEDYLEGLCGLFSAPEMQDLLAAVNGVAVKSSDKNTRTRALWVISKQAFPPEVVQKEVSSCIFPFGGLLSHTEEASEMVKKVSSFIFHFGAVLSFCHSPLSGFRIQRLFPIKSDSQISILGIDQFNSEPEIIAFLEGKAAMSAALSDKAVKYHRGERW